MIDVIEREGFWYALIKLKKKTKNFEGQRLHSAICNTVFFTEREQVYSLTEQFLVKTCQNQHELQNKYVNTCSFNRFLYDLEISGVSRQWWTTRVGRSVKHEAAADSVQPMCHSQCKQETFLRQWKQDKAPEAPPDSCSWRQFTGSSTGEFGSSVAIQYSEFKVTLFVLYYFL